MKILIFHKKPIKRRDCLKRGLGQFANLKWGDGGLSRKRRWCFLRGGGGGEGLIPQCILCFLTKLKGKGRPFLEDPKKGATLWDYSQEQLVVLREEKIFLFVKLKFKLIFQMQPSCHSNICIKHWRKLYNLTTFFEFFSYLKNNDSVEHVQKVLLIVLFIYFQGQIKFSHCIWLIWLF